MLRFLLGTLILLSSAFPALAENLVCSYKHVRGLRRIAQQPAPASPTASLQAIEPFSPMVLSVFYPGLIVLMTMMAYYFLKVMEPQARHNEPKFVRSATALSGLWLVGFFPFLSSALGGLLFCVTGMACIGGWLLMRRFAGETRLRDRILVFWSFFFFSLLVALMVTGHGFGIPPLFSFIWGLGDELARLWGPVLLLLLNIGAVAFVLRVAGAKMPSPPSQETIIPLKIVSILLCVIFFDMALIGGNYSYFSWLPAFVFALPALAYYGVYWLVRRMPDGTRGRVSLSLFVLLALFLILLGSIGAGASPRETLAAALMLGMGVSVAGGLGLLWRSDAAQAWKLFALALAAAALTGSGWVLFMFDGLVPDAQDFVIRNRFLLGWLEHKGVAATVFAVYGTGLLLFLTRSTARAKMALAGTMIFPLLLFWLGVERLTQASLGPSYITTPAGQFFQQPAAAVPYDGFVKDCVIEK